MDEQRGGDVPLTLWTNPVIMEHPDPPRRAGTYGFGTVLPSR